MKKLFILCSLIGLLAACGKSIKIIDTNEKAIVSNDAINVYETGDTIIVKWSYDYDKWQVDRNWLDFDSTSYQEGGFPRYYKAIVQ